MTGLGETDARVLRALPMNSAAVRWRTVTELSGELDLHADVVESVLTRLQGRSLVEHDGGWPRRWARLPRADRELEMAA